MNGNDPARLARPGFTLLELVVVMIVLAALLALVVPRLNGLVNQSSSVTNAAVVDEINRAVAMFEARFASDPSKKLNGWDSLLNSEGELFSKLHPNVVNTAADVTKPQLQVATLDANQVKSLVDAKISGLHDADEARIAPPSDNSSVYRPIAVGKEVVTLVKPPVTNGHGSTFIDNAFSINQYKANWNHEYIVLGLGGPTSLKGSAIREIPLIQSAEPLKYYARVMCVFMIPANGATTSFPAQYVGCFLPDGSSLRGNLDTFNNNSVTSN